MFFVQRTTIRHQISVSVLPLSNPKDSDTVSQPILLHFFQAPDVPVSPTLKAQFILMFLPEFPAVTLMSHLAFINMLFSLSGHSTSLLGNIKLPF